MNKTKTVTAAAHKLARVIYTMLTKGEDQGQDYYEGTLPRTGAATTVPACQKNGDETRRY
jgi:hypothetical protein